MTDRENDDLLRALFIELEQRQPHVYSPLNRQIKEWMRAALNIGLEQGRIVERLPDLDLLRNLADGTGGRRTSDLIRRGWIRIEVTELGRAALRAEPER